jgi:heat shock protein HslJ
MLPPDVTVTAFFAADGGLSGNAGCNPYNTTYVVSDQAITIHPPVTGMALCGDPADSVEQNYLRLLPQAANFRIEGDQLVITNNSGIEILRYNRIG